MRDTLIIVFTQKNRWTKDYLKKLGLIPRFKNSEDCNVAAVNYPSGGGCVDHSDHYQEADILLVRDNVDVSGNVEDALRHYIDEVERVVLVYHKGKGNYRKDVRNLCEGKEICSTEEHSTRGNAFDALTKIAAAVSDPGDREQAYEEAVNQIIAPVCSDLVLEAKLGLLHDLLVPPNKDSEEWAEIDEWDRLMGLVEDDPDESEEDAKRYEEAWEVFINADPQQYSDDPFNEEYCGSEDNEGILEKLRDGLLSTAP